LTVHLERVGRENRGLQKGRPLVEDGDVAGRADILRRDVGQPQEIVRAP
jgi:hypothetical protein